MLDSIYDITLGYLNRYSIKGILLDMDNTILPRGLVLPSLQTASWVADLKDHGIKLCILSNNSNAQRVAAVSDYLDIPAVCKAYKPIPLVSRKAIEQVLATPPEQTMIVGDQFYTDVVCGNLLGIRSVYVQPMAPELVWYRKLLISLDKGFYGWLQS